MDENADTIEGTPADTTPLESDRVTIAFRSVSGRGYLCPGCGFRVRVRPCPCCLARGAKENARQARPCTRRVSDDLRHG
jgi:hypothetical protein